MLPSQVITVDCKGHVHSAGQCELFDDPSCLPLESTVPLLRKVKQKMGSTNEVGFVCRGCFLSHYQDMATPPPSPVKEPEPPRCSCAVCMELKVATEFDDLMPLTSYPNCDAILKALSLNREDLGNDPICRECGLPQVVQVEPVDLDSSQAQAARVEHHGPLSQPARVESHRTPSQSARAPQPVQEPQPAQELRGCFGMRTRSKARLFWPRKGRI